MIKGTTTVVLCSDVDKDRIPKMGSMWSDEITGLHGKVVRMDHRLDGRVVVVVQGIAPTPESAAMQEHRSRQLVRSSLCDALYELCDDFGQEDLVDNLRQEFGL